MQQINSPQKRPPMIRQFHGLLRGIRPHQWSKNVLVFAALLFSKNMFHPLMVGRAAAGFLAFCALSGATYLFNDIMDRDKDRSHPEKRNRPIASGLLSIPLAAFGAVILTTGSLLVALFIDRFFFVSVGAYLVLQVLYTLALKNVVILDVFAITAGFVLRVLGGAFIIDGVISSWLVVCTFLLALFLALCKRRHELHLLEGDAASHRKVLGEYTTTLLDQMISVTTASTVIAYTLYTLSEQTIEKFGTAHLVYTVPFVIYGIFRYLYLVHIRKQGGNPETLLVSDVPLMADISAWALVAAAIIYL